MTWAGWMRRWARRVAMRRISWTDQRMRAGLSGSGTIGFRAVAAAFLWGRLVCVMADAGHHGERQHDQGHVPVPAVPGPCFVVVEAKHRSWRTQSCPRWPSGSPRPGPACPCLCRPGTRLRRPQACCSWCCAGPAGRGSTGHRCQGRTCPRRGWPVQGRPNRRSAAPWCLLRRDMRCQAEASRSSAISSAVPDTDSVALQEWE